MNQVSNKPVVIMAGGTGGHVFPALAVAEYLRSSGETLAGTVLLIALYTLLGLRCFSIGKMALLNQQAFGAYLAYGVGLLIMLQAIINIGVNLGALPTKGMTLPFVSYGGNSILSLSLAIGLVLRVFREYQFQQGVPTLKQRRRINRWSNRRMTT